MISFGTNKGYFVYFHISQRIKAKHELKHNSVLLSHIINVMSLGLFKKPVTKNGADKFIYYEYNNQVERELL